MFTKENAQFARDNARKGNAIRWAPKPSLPDPPPQLIVAPAQDANSLRIAAQVERVQKQITRIEELLEQETDGKELNNLSAAHQRLFIAWCTLTNTPRPGSRKPAATPRAVRQGSGQPGHVPGPLPSGVSETGAQAWPSPPAPISAPAPLPVVSQGPAPTPQEIEPGRAAYGQNSDEPNG